jgi:hypothetical protein
MDGDGQNVEFSPADFVGAVDKVGVMGSMMVTFTGIDISLHKARRQPHYTPIDHSRMKCTPSAS